MWCIYIYLYSITFNYFENIGSVFSVAHLTMLFTTVNKNSFHLYLHSKCIWIVWARALLLHACALNCLSKWGCTTFFSYLKILNDSSLTQFGLSLFHQGIKRNIIHREDYRHIRIHKIFSNILETLVFRLLQTQALLVSDLVCVANISNT